MSDRETVHLERGYVLHQRPFRNTSQLLECLTASYGRIGLIARGSKRARTGQRALLQPFVLLRLSWIRRGELGRLTGVEAVSTGMCSGLVGQALFAGYYANELLLRLSVRGDANEKAYACYGRCLAELAEPDQSVARTLRLFELRLLDALGYGLELQCEVDGGEPLRADGHYRYVTEHGIRVADRIGDDGCFLGSDLISLRCEALDDEASLNAARRLLGSVLLTYLGERPLRTREVLKDIVARGL